MVNINSIQISGHDIVLSSFIYFVCRHSADGQQTEQQSHERRGESPPQSDQKSTATESTTPHTSAGTAPVI